MSFIRIASVLCIIQFVVLSGGLGLSEHNTAIGKRDLSSDLSSEGVRRQAVDFALDLRTAQVNAQNFGAELGATIATVLANLEKALESAADRLAGVIQRVLALASAANTADIDCILNDTPFTNITLGFKSDMFGCLEGAVNRITDLGHTVNDIQWKLNSIIKRTETAISSCIGGNLVTAILCSIEYFPGIGFSTLSLLSEVVGAGLDLVTLLPVIIIRAIGCVAGSLGGRITQVGDVDVTTIRCLVNHLKTIRTR